MALKVSLRRLEDLLSYALADRNKAFIAPARYVFGEKQVVFKQTTQDKLIAVWATFDPKFFEEYEPIGDLIVMPNNLIAVLRDHFPHSPTITIRKTGDKLILESEIAKYEEPLLGVSIDDIEADTKTYEEVIYPIREGFDLKALFTIDLSVFKKAKKKWELIRFYIKKDSIDYSVELGAGKITYHLMAKPVLSPSKEYNFAVRPELMQMFAKVLPATVQFGIVASDEEVGVVVISVKTDTYHINYWMIPEVGT